MLRKYGTLEVLSAAIGQIPRGTRSLDPRLGHRAVFSFVPRAGFLYVRSRVLRYRWLASCRQVRQARTPLYRYVFSAVNS